MQLDQHKYSMYDGLVLDDKEKGKKTSYLFHILPMKPASGFASCMLCRRATEPGSSLRFWAARLAKRPEEP